MNIEVMAIVESRKEAVNDLLNKLRASGVELIDVNGEPVLYRGYMSVRCTELWEVDTHGAREYWVMSHCDFSTRYMYKRRYRVANHYRVVNGVAGNEWYETQSYALRAAGRYGAVYRYDHNAAGEWVAVEKIKEAYRER